MKGYVAWGCAGLGPCGGVAVGTGKGITRLTSVLEHATSNPLAERGVGRYAN